MIGQVNSDVKLFIRENNKPQNLMLQSLYIQCIVCTIKPYYSFQRHLDICTVLGMLESKENDRSDKLTGKAASHQVKVDCVSEELKC